MSEEARSWWEESPPPEYRAPWGDPPPVEQPIADAEPPAPLPEGPPRSDPEATELRDRVSEALKNVIDPELGINIVDLGLVYGIDVYDDLVHVTYTLTTMGCPIGPLIEAEMQRFLADVPGVERFQAEMVFRPPWTPEMMSEEAKAAMGFF
jgi:metal-sulfur cluster biosynthetic enzyme